MINLKNSLFVLFVVLSATVALQAQKTLPTGQVDIIKQFNARLIDAERYVLPPMLPLLDTNNRKQFYNILVRPMNISYLAPKIRPLEWKTQDAQKIYKGYLQTGYGTPNSFYLDGTYDFVTQTNINVGVDIYHYSANNSKLVENQRFGDTKVAINGIYNDDAGYSVNATLGYELNKLNFYGYNEISPKLTYAAKDVAQRFSKLFGSAKIYNSERTAADFSYSAQGDFYSLSDNYAARETGLNLDFRGTKWFEEKHPLTLILQTDFTGYQDTASQSLNNIFLKPSFTFHGDRLRVKVGGVIASSSDKVKIFPDLEVSAIVVENLLTAFVGADGGLQKNNFKSLTEYNPFVSSRVRIRNSAYNNFFGGIKGEFQGIQYRGQVGYKKVDNLALFTTTKDSIPRFNVVYDTATIITISGELNTKLMENFVLSANFTQNFFTLNTNAKPWHLPSLTFNVGGVLSMLDDKLKIRADLYLQNGVPVKGTKGEIKNLQPLYDLSVGAQYQFTKNIGGFIRVNNMLNNLRQRWQYYSVLPVNGMVGLTARF